MYVHVRVMPGARREALTETSPAHLQVSVKEPAAQNLANRRVQELVARHYRATKVRLVSGHRSTSKIFFIG